ncbi:MAG: glutamate-cysteine ligase family protein [Acidimicrobiales bacterium]
MRHGHHLRAGRAARELSTRPAAGLEDACSTLARDLDTVDAALSAYDIGLVGIGLDPSAASSPRRVVRHPRYDAMDGYFADQGPFGATMMCATAGMQVNLDCERSGPCPTLRFGFAHLVGPTLAASFANSPLAGDRPTGWKSSRLANWWRLDPSRTAPAASPGSEASAWPAYALAARVK